MLEGICAVLLIFCVYLVGAIILIIHSYNTKLRTYSNERGLTEPFNINSLINSHRRLVFELNQGQRTDYQEVWNESIRNAVAEAERSVREDGWISKERLSSMSLQEIANWVGEETG